MAEYGTDGKKSIKKAPHETRTHDLRITNALLYQLS